MAWKTFYILLIHGEQTQRLALYISWVLGVRCVYIFECFHNELRLLALGADGEASACSNIYIRVYILLWMLCIYILVAVSIARCV